MPFDRSLGFVLALAAMALYGLYMVPRRSSRASQRVFAFWMGWGVLLGSLLAAVLQRGGPRPVSPAQYAVMFGSGLLWATGTLAYSAAVKRIGLARSTPIKNTSAILGTLLGILVFREIGLSRPADLAAAVIGSAAIVYSAALLGNLEAFDDAREEQGSRHMLQGTLLAVWAAVAYSLYTVPMKMLYAQGLTPTEFLFYMGQGCFVGMVGSSFLLRRSRPAGPVAWRDAGLAVLSGLMWTAGSLCANTAIKLVGVAIAWPITKNTLVAVLYGVLVLKEIDAEGQRKGLALGLFLSLLGIVLLAAALT